MAGMCSAWIAHAQRTHSCHRIGCCLISLGSIQRGSRSKNNLRHITYGKGYVWGMPSFPPLFSLAKTNKGNWILILLSCSSRYWRKANTYSIVLRLRFGCGLKSTSRQIGAFSLCRLQYGIAGRPLYRLPATFRDAKIVHIRDSPSCYLIILLANTYPFLPHPFPLPLESVKLFNIN